MNPYSLPAQTKIFHKLGQLRILANNQLTPEHDSSLPILPSNQPFSPHPEPTPSPRKIPPPPHTSPASPHPISPGMLERNARLQDTPLPVCHRHFNATSECLRLCLEQEGGAALTTPTPGLAQEAAAEVRPAESADPAQGDHFYSDASPSSSVQLLRP